jgi:2-hydroxymuconate-semialdehyde hydrolase
MAGFGFSDKPGNYSMEGWVQQLDAFLTALQLDKVSLVGNSFGGGLALAFAARWPERVDKLVLMGRWGSPHRGWTVCGG